jgi:hypothetical protein
MLKFYWPYSAIGILIGGFYGGTLSTLFTIGIAVEVATVLIILIRIQKDRDLDPVSFTGILASQYDFGSEFQLPQLISDSGFRILAYLLGVFGALWYVPTMILLLWSTIKLPDFEV